MTTQPTATCPICFGTGELRELHRFRWIRDDVSREVPHLFHEECIRLLLESGATRCPTCQTALTDEERSRFVPLHPIGGDDANARGSALWQAARAGQWDEVLRLLGSGPISMNSRCGGVSSAARAGRLDIVQALLANGPIYKICRSQAVVNATRAGSLDIVQALLANGPISENYRSAAVSCAVRASRTDIVDALLLPRT